MATTQMKDAQPLAVLVGGGRINLGAWAVLLYEIGFLVHVVNILSDKVIDQLKAFPYLFVSDEAPTRGSVIPVDGAHYVPDGIQDHEGIEAAARAQLICFGLGTSPSAVQAAALFLVKVLRCRLQLRIKQPLNVTSADNPAGQSFSTDLIQTALDDLLPSLLTEQECTMVREEMENNVSFVRAISDRICATRVVPESKGGGMVTVFAEKHCTITFERFPWLAEFVGRQPCILPSGVIHFKDIEMERKLKLYGFNSPHATAALLVVNSLKPHRKLNEALADDPAIRYQMMKAQAELVEALSMLQSMNKTELQALVARNRQRMEELPDEPSRVLGDLERKLHRDDRILGPVLMFMKKSGRVPDMLVQNVVLALTYALQCAQETEDSANRRLGLRLQSEGVARVLVDVAQLNRKVPRENELITVIEKRMGAITQGQPMAGDD